MRCYLAALLLFVCVPVTSQRANLYTPVWHGRITPRVLKGDSHPVVFTLSTSWIPGPSGKGVLRYRIHGSIDRRFDKQQFQSVADNNGNFHQIDPDKVYNDGIPEALEKIRQCSFTLILYDDAGFKLREIPISFVGEVDVYDTLSGLEANDTSPMSAEEYRHVIKENSSWNVAWSSCPLF